MTEHTKEPWSVGHTRQSHTDPRIGPFHETAIHIGRAENRGNCLAIAYMGGDGALRSDAASVEANARRIVVCVNACQGLATEELEAISIADRLADLGQTLLNTVDQRDAATAQRDEVLAALETLENAARGIDGLAGCSEIAIARDTLKKYRRFK